MTKNKSCLRPAPSTVLCSALVLWGLAIGAIGTIHAEELSPQGPPPGIPPRGPSSDCFSFTDDFDDGNVTDGSPVSWQDNTGGKWVATGGVYKITNATFVNTTSYDPTAQTPSHPLLENFELEFDVDLLQGNDRDVMLRRQDDRNTYEVNVRIPPHTLIIVKKVDGANVVLAQKPFANAFGPMHVKVSIRQFKIKVEVNGVLELEADDPDQSYASGGVALVGHFGAIEYDNVTVRCLPGTTQPPGPQMAMNRIR